MYQIFANQTNYWVTNHAAQRMLQRDITLMKLNYDPTADALYIELTENPVVTTRKVTSELMVDLDEHEQVVGIEVLRVRQTGIDPFTVVSSLLAPTLTTERQAPEDVTHRRAQIAAARKRHREAQNK